MTTELIKEFRDNWINEIGSPKSPESELAIITIILKNGDLIKEVIDLPYKYFITSEYNIIYRCMKELYKDNIDINYITLIEKVKSSEFNLLNDIKNRTLQEIVSESLIITLSESSFAVSSQLQYYKNLVIKNYSRRYFLDKLEKERINLLDPTSSAEEVAIRVIKEANDFIEKQPTINNSINSDCDNSLKYLQETYPVIKTGIGFGDSEIKFERKQINTIGGMPGHCKTTIAVQMALNMLINGLSVNYFSLEMPKFDLIAKMVCNLAKVSHKRIRERIYTIDEFKSVKKAYEYMKDCFSSSLKIYDDIYDINSMIRIIKVNKPDAVFIDFLQLMPKDEKWIRQEINNILKLLQPFVKTTETAIINLSQLSRAIDSREDQRPRNSDLAESGRIEQLSRVIMFVHYDFKTNYINELVSYKKGRICYGKNILSLSISKSTYSDTFETKSWIEPECGIIRTMTRDEWELLKNETIKIKELK